MKKHLLPHIIYIIYASFNTSRLFCRRGKMEMYKRVIAFTLFVVFTFGFLTDCIAATKAEKALGQMAIGKYEKALKMISKELKKPSRSSRKDPCGLHAAALQIYSTTSTMTDLRPPDFDQLVQNSYDYIRENCESDTRNLGIAENYYANILLNTGKYGFAIPHYKRAEKLALTGFDRAIAIFNIAICYSHMGDWELCDHYQLKSLERFSQYFKTKRKYKYRLNESHEQINYAIVLNNRLSRLSNHILVGTENKKEGLVKMRKIWGEIEYIYNNKKWVSKNTRYVAYFSAMKKFAFVDKEFARELFVKAEKLSRKYPDKEIAKLDIIQGEALLLELEGKYREATVLMKDWIVRAAKLRTINAGSYCAVGRVQELAKDYDLAIDYLGKSVDQLEKSRLTFELGSRGQLFRTGSVNSYWGLMRSYAARYSEQNQNKDFQGAVKTARMLRGRQFGELIGIKYNTKEALDISKLKLKPDELLLNIFSTDTSLVVFAISSDWYDVLLVPYEKNEFDAKIKDVKVQIASTASDESEYINELQNISKVVLEPIADKLKEYNKLIIIPDGMLNCIPFTLLAQPSQEEYRPLISDYEVTLFPSISFMIRERNSEYKSASEKLLAFADPFYGSRKVPEAYRGDAEVFYKRAVNSFNLFTPLPETRTEVENISNLFKPEQVTSVFGEEANEQKLKSLPTEEYRYLHFATHGVLGSHIPGLDEPALVLSEEAEGSENDGYLTMSEVEKMKLNSDLVVLSACDTGSGKYLNGEGVMGLSRGFLLAGSRSVIASLWPVASGPTVKFMSQFYKHLKSGKSKSESLRLTQLAFMNEGEGMSGAGERGVTVAKGEDTTNLSHPSYWAPFVLIGE